MVRCVVSSGPVGVAEILSGRDGSNTLTPISSQAAYAADTAAVTLTISLLPPATISTIYCAAMDMWATAQSAFQVLTLEVEMPVSCGSLLPDAGASCSAGDGTYFSNAPRILTDGVTPYGTSQSCTYRVGPNVKNITFSILDMGAGSDSVTVYDGKDAVSGTNVCNNCRSDGELLAAGWTSEEGKLVKIISSGWVYVSFTSDAFGNADGFLLCTQPLEDLVAPSWDPEPGAGGTTVSLYTEFSFAVKLSEWVMVSCLLTDDLSTGTPPTLAQIRAQTTGTGAPALDSGLVEFDPTEPVETHRFEFKGLNVSTEYRVWCGAEDSAGFVAPVTTFTASTLEDPRVCVGGGYEPFSPATGKCDGAYAPDYGPMWVTDGSLNSDQYPARDCAWTVNSAEQIEIQSLDLNLQDRLLVYDGTSTGGTLLYDSSTFAYPSLGVLKSSPPYNFHIVFDYVNGRDDPCASCLGFDLCIPDLDECLLGLDNCLPTATCANTKGAFTCTCNAGYAGDGVTECTFGDCPSNSNLVGDECKCNQGFTGVFPDPGVCSQVDCPAGTQSETHPDCLCPGGQTGVSWDSAAEAYVGTCSTISNFCAAASAENGTNPCYPSALGADCFSLLCSVGYAAVTPLPACILGAVESANAVGGGVWSPAPACARSAGYCASITSPAACPSGVLDDLCLHSCDNGYVANIPRCSPFDATSGVWSPAPSCAPKESYCTVTETAAFSTAQCESAAMGEVCTGLTCETGYTPNAPVCTNVGGTPTSGTWSEPPACLPVQGYCPSKTAAQVSQGCAATEMGGSCTYTCSTGYLSPGLQSTGSLTCTNVGALNSLPGSGVWSSSPDMACSPVDNYCTGFTPPLADTSCASSPTDETCLPSCQLGYSALPWTCTVGASSAAGVGVWLPAPLECTAILGYCPTLYVANMAVGCSAGQMTDICASFECSSGYAANGIPQCSAYTENAGRWLLSDGSTPPSCVADGAYCRSVTPEYAAGACFGAPLGDSCTFTCQTGYSPTPPICTVGNETHGIWDPPPTCTPKLNYCAGTLSPTGALTNCAAADMGETCTTFTCAFGYDEPVSDPVCSANSVTAGVFSPPAVCSLTAGYCPGTSGTANAQTAAECPAAQLGATCVLGCVNGYQASSAGYSCVQGTALAGSWSPLPACLPKQDYCPRVTPANSLDGGCAPAAMEGGCTLQCETGYSAPQTPIVCQADSVTTGVFVPSPSCVVVADYCFGSTGTAHASVECPSSAKGAACSTLACSNGPVPACLPSPFPCVGVLTLV